MGLAIGTRSYRKDCVDGVPSDGEVRLFIDDYQPKEEPNISGATLRRQGGGA
jgi:hypothetical protein